MLITEHSQKSSCVRRSPNVVQFNLEFKKLSARLTHLTRVRIHTHQNRSCAFGSCYIQKHFDKLHERSNSSREKKCWDVSRCRKNLRRGISYFKIDTKMYFLKTYTIFFLEQKLVELETVDPQQKRIKFATAWRTFIKSEIVCTLPTDAFFPTFSPVIILFWYWFYTHCVNVLIIVFSILAWF